MARFFAALLCAFVMTGISAAQTEVRGKTGAGSISGTVTKSDGQPAVGQPIRALAQDRSTDARTYTDEAGRYTLPDLPPGTYDLSTRPLECCERWWFSDEDGVELADAETLEFDITTEPWDGFSGLSDNPMVLTAELLDRRQLPDDLSIRRMPGGEPDITGTWLLMFEHFPNWPEAQEWSEEARAEQQKNRPGDSQYARCLPSQPWVMSNNAVSLMELVQRDDLMIMLAEGTLSHRRIPLSDDQMPGYSLPGWYGSAKGEWVDDTLVIKTSDFNGRHRLNGFPMTDQMTVEERYTVINRSQISAVVTVTDPGALTAPFVQEYMIEWMPQENLLEYVCEENRFEVIPPSEDEETEETVAEAPEAGAEPALADADNSEGEDR